MQREQSSYARLLGISGDLRIDFIESEALRGNPLSDPHTRPVAVYLPETYDPHGSPSYPVLYCLP